MLILSSKGAVSRMEIDDILLSDFEQVQASVSYSDDELVLKTIIAIKKLESLSPTHVLRRYVVAYRGSETTSQQMGSYAKRLAKLKAILVGSGFEHLSTSIWKGKLRLETAEILLKQLIRVLDENLDHLVVAEITENVAAINKAHFKE